MCGKHVIVFSLVLISIFQASAEDLNLKVRLLSADHVYLDGGRTAGVSVGDTVEIYRAGKQIALLEVHFIASYSSSCKIITSSNTIKVGDKAVVKTKSGEQIQPAPTERRRRKVEKPNNESPERSKNSTPISGMMRLQWYQFNDTENIYSYREPSLRIKLNADQFIFRHVSLRVRTRTRYHDRARRYNSSIQKNEVRNRIYEISFDYADPNQSLGVKLGRLISSHYSGIGFIDGAEIRYKISQTGILGVFAGFQPQWQYSDFQTSLQKYGGFFQYNKESAKDFAFRSTIAVSGEYHGLKVSREFMYFMAHLSKRQKWYLYTSLELDVNRSWRMNKTDEVISPSRIYISGRYNLNHRFTANISYRSSKRYYSFEYRNLADSLFDAVVRQSLRTGMTVKLSKRIRSTFKIGYRNGISRDAASKSYDANLYIKDFLWRRNNLTLNLSAFSAEYSKGFYPRIRLDQYFHVGHRASLSYGQFAYETRTFIRRSINNWLRLGLYLNLPFKMFMDTNIQKEWGDRVNGNKVRLSLGYRF